MTEKDENEATAVELKPEVESVEPVICCQVPGCGASSHNASIPNEQAHMSTLCTTLNASPITIVNLSDVLCANAG